MPHHDRRSSTYPRRCIALCLLIAACTGQPAGSPRARASTSTLPFTNLAVRQAAVLYARPGIALIGIGGPFNSGSDVQPKLYLSSDLVHWRDITPRAALARDGISGDVNLIIDASWISATTGWIETCRSASYTEAIFQTTDAGRTWRSIPDPSGSYELRCADSIQLLRPNVGVESSGRTFTKGIATLEVTDNDGRTWTAPYGTIGFTSAAVPDGGVVFENPDDAVAPGTAYGTGPGLQVSHDGGRTWTAVLPPAPPDPGIQYDDIAFGHDEEVLPVVGVNTAGAATVQLDTSADGGSTWTVASRMPFQAQAFPPSSVAPTTTRPTYDEQVDLSVTKDGAWWLTLGFVKPDWPHRAHPIWPHPGAFGSSLDRLNNRGQTL